MYSMPPPNFSQVVAVSLLLYVCTTWMLTIPTRCELDKKATSYFEQILKATPYETKAL